jgi:hypothetical protein
VGFLERDFERDHLAKKSYWTKMGQKIHCGLWVGLFWPASISLSAFLPSHGSGSEGREGHTTTQIKVFFRESIGMGHHFPPFILNFKQPWPGPFHIRKLKSQFASRVG